MTPDQPSYVGLFTKGKTAGALRQMTGLEKLPVLRLTDGSFVVGSRDIIAWTRENPPPRT